LAKTTLAKPRQQTTAGDRAGWVNHIAAHSPSNPVRTSHVSIPPMSQRIPPPPSHAPEITWSIMHPVKPDRDYMQQVLAAAAAYRVDSFEVCGDVHSSTGNLDGAIRFRDYPGAAAKLDLDTIEHTI